MESKCLKTTIKSCNIQVLEKKKKFVNKQRCKENGVVHWECHYPYGNGELHETSNMCSIDLDTLAEEG